MFTRPDDLSDSDVGATLAKGWGLDAQHLDYAAVGYGSHHWRVTADSQPWFISVDDLESRRRDPTESRLDAQERLCTALTAARSLRRAGLEFVVAPIPTLAGAIVHPIDDRYALALYRHVDGKAHPWGPYPTRDDRLEVLERLIAVHGADPSIAAAATHDDFAIPRRDHLVDSLADRETRWGPGPFAAQARDLLHRHRAALERVLVVYDQLAVHVASQAGRFVVTHGEPHRGNTINTVDGVVLIDWDTTLAAPPERDLWSLIDEDPDIASEYTERTGVAIDDIAIRLYRLWWDVCEISLFIADLRTPHDDTDDMQVAWSKLSLHLDPARWHALIEP